MLFKKKSLRRLILNQKKQEKLEKRLDGEHNS